MTNPTTTRLRLNAKVGVGVYHLLKKTITKLVGGTIRYYLRFPVIIPDYEVHSYVLLPRLPCN